MDLVLTVGVWAVGAWLAYRCARSSTPHGRGSTREGGMRDDAGLQGPPGC